MDPKQVREEIRRARARYNPHDESIIHEIELGGENFYAPDYWDRKRVEDYPTAADYLDTWFPPEEKTRITPGNIFGAIAGILVWLIIMLWFFGALLL